MQQVLNPSYLYFWLQNKIQHSEKTFSKSNLDIPDIFSFKKVTETRFIPLKTFKCTFCLQNKHIKRNSARAW